MNIALVMLHPCISPVFFGSQRRVAERDGATALAGGGPAENLALVKCVGARLRRKVEEVA